jgi:mannose-6-phosphate isomerase-like protein (cupin superfamily)
MIDQLLNKLLDVYKQKRHAEESLKIGFEILPEKETWYLLVSPDDPLYLTQEPEFDPQIIFSCHFNTLSDICAHKITGLTAMGRENMHDETPLNYRLGPNQKMDPALFAQGLEFVQRFFNPTYPEKIDLDKSKSRQVHGAWAITMFYHPGFRSAWYQIEKGQSLNKPGDTNPFPQAFVLISGHGYAKIGDVTLKVNANEAYYIPPNTDHVFWTEDESPLELIFLAWGAGA